jgi:hypothetical protein
MPNTSATGGYLLPDPTTNPIDDGALDAFLQAIVVGVTGLAGSLVRPRWQPEPPNLPDYGTDWAAIGVTDYEPDDFAVEIWNPNTLSTDLQRQEKLSILVRFYGPNARSYSGLFRDGLQLDQNREQLYINGFALVNTGRPLRVPELIKDRWLDRVDIPWTCRRAIDRNYQVLSLVSAGITLEALDKTLLTETINVTQ